MESFHVDILAAACSFYAGPCVSLVVPTPDGKRGVQANHCNMIAAITPGELSYTLPGERPRLAAVSSGLIKIEDGRVLVLVETAERPEDIDKNRAQRVADVAREAMLQKMSRREYLETQAQLARSINRLRVKHHAEQLND
ncbi:ATP synthase F1 subunit epsilon [Beduinella massiliensis]|uniref:ATP synthase F1 subunit epsilon n=1 Tax=Beduinella massiliensis TaxID=1852363 RepID=UPI000C83B284